MLGNRPMPDWIASWIFQIIGHAFEGKAPGFFKDWRFQFVGSCWGFAKMSGRA